MYQASICKRQSCYPFFARVTDACHAGGSVRTDDLTNGKVVGGAGVVASLKFAGLLVGVASTVMTTTGSVLLLFLVRFGGGDSETILGVTVTPPGVVGVEAAECWWCCCVLEEMCPVGTVWLD